MTEEELAQELTELPNGQIQESVKRDVANELAQGRSRNERPQRQVFRAKYGLTPFRQGTVPIVEIVRLPDGRFLAMDNNPNETWLEIVDNPQSFVNDVLGHAYDRAVRDEHSRERFDIETTNNQIGYATEAYTEGY